MRKIFKIFILALFLVGYINSAYAAKLFQTSLDREGGSALQVGDPAIIAKYDMVIIDRFNLPSSVQAAIRAINPAISIHVYTVGMEMPDDQDSWSVSDRNGIVGYSSLYAAHPELFLRDSSGNIIHDPDYTDYVLMDFGAAAYQQYWAQQNQADIVGQAWNTGAIFVDRCDSMVSFSQNTKYPTDATWIPAMTSFVSGVQGLMGTQKLFVNAGNTRYPDGQAAWKAFDASATPPDAILEEGAFAIRWGAPVGGVYFFDEGEWLNQVSLMGQIHHSKTIWEGSTRAYAGANGTDQIGKSFNYWDIYWYCMCSYLIGKNTVDNNSYFQFNVQSSAGDANVVSWADELTPGTINLGDAIGTYQVTKVNGVNIYWRQYQNGYVYVNPTTNDVASISLPQIGKQLSHANFTSLATIPNVTTISLPGNRGTIVLNTTTSPPSPPAAPANLRLAP